MSKAEIGHTVKIACVGALDDGTLFDRSSEGDDLTLDIALNKIVREGDER